MKTFPYFFLIVMSFLTFRLSAQTITIPDPSFVTWLNNNGYAGCMSGNQLDASCPAVINTLSLTCIQSNISDITGVEAFVNLVSLNCGFNQLSFLPTLPTSLVVLDCHANNLTDLPSLPPALMHLDCGNNNIWFLPQLPSTLTHLLCYGNVIDLIPDLPNGFKQLSCESNQLLFLDNLPSSMNYLDCHDNNLQGLPTLPDSLTELICYDNDMTFMPALPSLLEELNCSNNLLTTLPTLPTSLTLLNCSNNSLSSLPVLNAGLSNLKCSSCQLQSLPVIPSSLLILDCAVNQITYLPPLPSFMLLLNISFNPGIICLPPIQNIISFLWNNTGIACLPNVISVVNSTPTVSNVPICNGPGPTAPTSIGVAGGNVKVCAGDTVTYNTPIIAGHTYQWNVPVGASIIGGQGTTSITVAYQSGFTASGAVSVATVASCSTSAPFTLNVYRNLALPPSAITGDIYGLCNATNVAYSISSTPGVTYQWSVITGATITSGQGTNSITVDFPSGYFAKPVSVHAVNACGAGRSRNLVVRSVPGIPAAIGGPVSVCAGQTMVSYATANVPSATSYNWTVPRYAAITSGQGSSIITVDFGTASGNVRVRAANACGNGSYKILPVAITCREEMQIDVKDINIYPNPSSENYTLSNNKEDVQLIIYEITGKEINRFEINAGDQLLFGDDLPSGIYMATIISNEATKVIRLLKQ